MRTFSVRLASSWKPSSSSFVTIVIDVLRATTVVATALANGATRVIPVRDIDEALALKERLGTGAILGGERNNRRIEGFDLGNSPAEYDPSRVSGKTVVLTTTNGTSAIHRAKTHALRLYTAALVNVAAVADRACRGEHSILAVCAGTEGEFSLEDWLCAGALADACGRNGLSLDDAAIAAAELFRATSLDLDRVMNAGAHAQMLRRGGFANDIAFCAALDRYDVAPCLVGDSLENER